VSSPLKGCYSNLAGEACAPLPRPSDQLCVFPIVVQTILTVIGTQAAPATVVEDGAAVGGRPCRHAKAGAAARLVRGEAGMSEIAAGFQEIAQGSTILLRMA
jgi:hypothetical protein